MFVTSRALTGVDLSTRERITKAAWEIIVSEGHGAATMGAVARRAGLSRQALYLHFQDRAELLVELVAYGDRQSGRAEWQREVEAIEDIDERLVALVAAYQERAVRMAAVIRAVESARYVDAAAATAHSRRVQTSRPWIDNVIVQPLLDQGRIDPSWTRAEAVALILSYINFRGWEHFVTDFSWTRRQFVDVATAAILGSLQQPITRRRQSPVWRRAAPAAS